MSKRRSAAVRALREFLVIVVGVLTALAVDEYIGERNEAQLAAYHIARLEADLQDTENRLTYLLGQLTQSERAAAAVTEVLRGQAVPTDPSAIIVEVARAGANNTPNVRRTAFQELSETGGLRFVQPPELRTAILDYYTAVATEERWFQTLDLRARTLSREIIEHRVLYAARVACPIDQIREPMTCSPELDSELTTSAVSLLLAKSDAVQIYNGRAFELTRARERIERLLAQTQGLRAELSG